MSFLTWIVDSLGLGVSAIGLLVLGMFGGYLLKARGISLTGSLAKPLSAAVRLLPSAIVQGILRHLAAQYYHGVRNAYVTNDIEESTHFLDHFFDGIPSQRGDSVSGEVWLFQTDLAAFRNDLYFARLYGDRVLKWDDVKKVKAVISSRMAAVEGMEAARTQTLLKQWSNIVKNLQNARGANKVQARWMKHLPDLSRDFKRFVSDENWILYVWFNRRDAYQKICIHRRFLSPAEDLVGSSGPGDERITITGSFPKPNDPIYKDGDPVLRFTKKEYLVTFEAIFTANEGWQPLLDIAVQEKFKLESNLRGGGNAESSDFQ